MDVGCALLHDMLSPSELVSLAVRMLQLLSTAFLYALSEHNAHEVCITTAIIPLLLGRSPSKAPPAPQVPTCTFTQPLWRPPHPTLLPKGLREAVGAYDHSRSIVRDGASTTIVMVQRLSC